MVKFVFVPLTIATKQTNCVFHATIVTKEEQSAGQIKFASTQKTEEEEFQKDAQ